MNQKAGVINISLRYNLIKKITLIMISLASVFGNSLHGQLASKDFVVHIERASTSHEYASMLLEKCDHIRNKHWEESLNFAKTAFKLSEENDYQDIKSAALLRIGDITYYNIDRDTTIHIYQEGYLHAIEQNDSEYIYNFALKIAEWHLWRSHDYTQSEEYFMKAIETAIKTESFYEVARAYARIAKIYVFKKDLEKAEEFIKKSTSYFLLIGNARAAAYYNCDIGNRLWEFDMSKAVDFYLKGSELDNTHYYVNLCFGNAYISLGLPEIAIPHLDLAIDSLEVDNWRYGVCISNLAEAHVQLQNYVLADSLCNFNINEYRNSSSRSQTCLSKSYLIKGQIQELQNNLEGALEFYEISLKAATVSNSSLDKTHTLLATGTYYLRIGNTNLSNTFCKKAYQASVQNSRKKLQSRACDCLYLTEKRNANFDEALKYLEEKDQLDQALDASIAVQKLDVYKRLTLREKEDAYEHKLRDETLKSQKRTTLILTILISLGALFILALSIMISRIMKQNKEINIQSNILRKTNEELERFAYIVSHDLKTPLLIIVQFTKLLANKLNSTAQPIVRESIQHIERGGTRMMKLIEDVLDFSKDSSTDVEEQEIKLGNLLSELFMNDHRNTKLIYDYDKLPTIQSNYTKVLLLFKNLIENGLKYNDSENPTVEVYTTRLDKELIVCIKDNGIGIQKQYLDKIFTMFTRLHTHQAYSGTGLGLATCTKIANEFQGKISVESKFGTGSTFMIHFPLNMVK